VRGNVRELVECNFSTSGPVELTASQVALMDAMSPYFDYEIMAICGIPEVTLTGTVEDWKKVKGRSAESYTQEDVASAAKIIILGTPAGFSFLRKSRTCPLMSLLFDYR
jgi:hypothetical protein